MKKYLLVFITFFLLCVLLIVVISSKKGINIIHKYQQNLPTGIVTILDSTFGKWEILNLDSLNIREYVVENMQYARPNLNLFYSLFYNEVTPWYDPSLVYNAFDVNGDKIDDYMMMIKTNRAQKNTSFSGEGVNSPLAFVFFLSDGSEYKPESILQLSSEMLMLLRRHSKGSTHLLFPIDTLKKIKSDVFEIWQPITESNDTLNGFSVRYNTGKINYINGKSLDIFSEFTRVLEKDPYKNYTSFTENMSFKKASFYKANH